ncbi:MAG TPA: MFS transporter [Stellaceae bacterium]|nr:MFS transporter [Stellaceae bacterium]
MRDRTRLNVLILALCQALYLSASSIQVALSGLVGAMLAPDRLLATLPFSLITVMVASTTIPASFLMARLGRRAGFVLGALLGGSGGAISTIAIFHQSFAGFCVGNALMGCFQAVAQYYRFAAADAAEPAFKSRAISWVMAGGVAAALLGPGIAGFSKDLFAPVTFAGSYLAIVVLSGLSILLLSRLAIPRPAAAAGQGGRKLAVIARQPAFIAAVANNVIGYASMVFVMSATPLAAVACGHSSDDAIGIIRMHLIGMFAPSFFTGSLIARFGVTRILLAGAAMLLASALSALSGLALYNFWAALALLGVGWNFLYVGGTTLLTAAYRPEERTKTQAANEFITFGVVACASFASGGVMARLGWAAISYATIAPLLVAAAATLWYAAVSRRPLPAPATLPRSSS